MNIKILVCQIIGPAAAGSAGPVPTPVAVEAPPPPFFVRHTNRPCGHQRRYMKRLTIITLQRLTPKSQRRALRVAMMKGMPSKKPMSAADRLAM